MVVVPPATGTPIAHKQVAPHVQRIKAPELVVLPPVKACEQHDGGRRCHQTTNCDDTHFLTDKFVCYRICEFTTHTVWLERSEGLNIGGLIGL